MFRRILAVLLLFWAGSPLAMMPESGVWWNSDESGTGFNFELQNNRIWMYAYTYEVNGLPVYLYGLADQVSSNTFAGTLMRSEAGACITCSYRPNVQAAVGSVQILFDSPSTATLTATTANGTRSTRLQRFAFAINESNPHKLFGEWSIVIGSASFPVYFGDRLGFSATDYSNGLLYAVGSRTGSSPNIALGRRDADGSWYILLDSSTSYYEFFQFRFSGLNTMEGTSWTYLKTSLPSGAGLPFVGLRSGSAMSVINGTGPALQKSANLLGMNNYEGVAASKAQLSGAPSDDPNSIKGVLKAQQIAREMMHR